MQSIQQSSRSREENCIRLNIPADFQYLSVVSAAIAAMLDQEQSDPAQELLIYQIQLAVHETCTNIIEHACAECSGHIEAAIRLEEPEQQLVIDLFDTGNSFVLSEFKSPNLEEPNTSGYGLFIIHELMDSVIYHPQPGRNHWRLVKSLN
jgi:serine/threonine-protein kinase RsbW